MAKVVVKVVGRTLEEREAVTVGALKTALSLTGYSASVNKTPAADDTRLSEGDFVSFAPNVKGG